MRLTMGAAIARPGEWRQRKFSRAYLIRPLTLRFAAPLVDTGTDNHDVVNDGETALACNPLAIFGQHIAVCQHSSGVHDHPLAMELLRIG